MNVEPLSQRDPAWAGVRLGYAGTSNLGNYGCYLTCDAMLATAYGHPITPDALNALMIARGGFVQGNLLADTSLERAFGDCVYAESLNYATGPADLPKLAALLAEPGTGVILEVDFDHDPNDGIQTHFVVAVGVENGVPIIADPWYGTVGPMAEHYGPNPALIVQKYVVYNGPVEGGSNVDDTERAEKDAKIAELESTNSALADQVTALHAEVSGLRDTVIPALAAQIGSGDQTALDDLRNRLQKIADLATAP